MTPPPGGPPPGGAPPMAMMASHPPAAGTGGAMAPGAALGLQAKAMETVKLGLKALQEGMVGLPIGSELHSAILKAVSDIGKHMEQGGQGGDPAQMMQALAQMARSTQASPQAQAMQRAFPPPVAPGGGAPPPPAGA